MASAQEMKPPQIVAVKVDWSAVLERTTRIASADSEATPLQALARLNRALPPPFTNAATSPVPVLLPLDTDKLLHDHVAGGVVPGNHLYLSGFHARTFFNAGPGGYDAALALRAAEIPELADIAFAEPIEVQITGSALIYELENAREIKGTPVPELEQDFPGIRRMMYEHHLRYAFERYGVPYVVSINCHDGRFSRYRLPACHAADRVVVRFLRALRIAGGAPGPARTASPLPVERPADVSPEFTFHPPGALLSGTSFRGQGGRADSTVYAKIRFPLAAAPAYANSQMYQRKLAAEQSGPPGYSYPWRDNFCERRGFSVGQCPAGVGHQGQDIRPAKCSPEPCRPSHDLVAVRDGAILRAPRQEAAYIVVNTEQEHIRFRYLHMHPRKMDDDGLVSGRMVREGEVIGQVSNFDKKEGGTSYHLHFDVQVPTRNGWVFVNPYMTLVGSYERLIGARGVQILPPVAAANPDAQGEAVKTADARPERASVRHRLQKKRVASGRTASQHRKIRGAVHRKGHGRRGVRTARR